MRPAIQFRAASHVLAWFFLLCLAGLPASAQVRPAAGTFRLSIGPEAEGEEVREATFKLECPNGASLEFEHVGALRLQSGWNSEPNVSNRTGTIRISLTRKAGKYDVAVGVETAAHAPHSGLSVTNSNLSHY